MQKLYGMEAEIAKKIEKKTEPLIEPMCKWLYEVVGEEATDQQFPDSLKSGRLLCALMNKLWPGIIPDVHTRPIALLERENIQKYLDACAKMGIRKDDLFGISDLYEEKYLAGVVQNVYAVARYVQQRKSWVGPILQPPAVEKASADRPSLDTGRPTAQRKSRTGAPPGVGRTRKCEEGAVQLAR